MTLSWGIFPLFFPFFVLCVCVCVLVSRLLFLSTSSELSLSFFSVGRSVDVTGERFQSGRVQETKKERERIGTGHDDITQASHHAISSVEKTFTHRSAPKKKSPSLSLFYSILLCLSLCVCVCTYST